MAIQGFLTSQGRTKSIEALSNKGWYIFPTRFEVSESSGAAFDDQRVGARDWQVSTSYALGDQVVPTTPNGYYFEAIAAGVSGGSEPSWPTTVGNTVVDGGVTWENKGTTSGGLESVWFEASITSRVGGPPDTVELILTIPPGADPTSRNITEIYIFAEDQSSNEFLLVVAQPDTEVTYDPDGTTTLRVAITISNANVGNLFIFRFTQATEIAEHNVDPNAHQDLRDAVRTQFNLLANGDMAIDRHPLGFDLSGGAFGYGPAEWAGRLVASTASGTLVRNESSEIPGSRSLHFSSITLSGGDEELHIRYRMRSETARLLSNPSWQATTAYAVGDIVFPASGTPNLLFMATTAGTSDSVEPTWPTIQGGTVSDGGVVWEAILGKASLSFVGLQDTGSTQYAVISFKTPLSGENNFDGALDTFFSTGATDHPMLDATVSDVELPAVAFPNVSDGLEIEVVVDAGAITNKNFEFSRFKLEPSSVVTPYMPVPHELEFYQSNPHLAAFLHNFEVVVATQSQIDSGYRGITINELDDSNLSDGDRILILPGTHTLTSAITLTKNDLMIYGATPEAVIDLDTNHAFSLTGTNNRMDVRFTNTFSSSIVLSGAGTKFFGQNVTLAHVDISNGAQVETTGTAGGIKRGSSAAPGNDRELVDKQYVDSLGIQAADIIIGDAAQVAAGDATHTIDDFNDSGNIGDGNLILVKTPTSGNHTLSRNEDIAANNVMFVYEAPDAIIEMASYTMTFSGTGAFLRLHFASVGTNALVFSGTDVIATLLIDSPPADPINNSGEDNTIIWNEHLIVGGDVDIAGDADIGGDINLTGSLDIGQALSYQSRTVTSLPDTAGTDVVIYLNPSGPGTFTIPQAGNSPDRVYYLKNISSFVVTLARSGSDTIEGETTYVLSSQGDAVILKSRSAANSWEAFQVGGGTGDITEEDLIYRELLNSSALHGLNYDAFKAPATVTTSGSPTPTYDGANTAYDGSSGSVITTGNLLEEHDTWAGTTAYEIGDTVVPTTPNGFYYEATVAGTSGGSEPTWPTVDGATTSDGGVTWEAHNATWYKLFVHVEADAPVLASLTVEYTTDVASPSWTAVSNLDEIVAVSAGFTELALRFTWGDSGLISSFGLLYNEGQYGSGSNVRMFEVYTAPSDLSAGTSVTIPNGVRYTDDGKSLEVFHGPLKRINGVDFTEENNQTVQIQFPMNSGEKLLFLEYYGLVDMSQNNANRIETSLSPNNGLLQIADNTNGKTYVLESEDGDFFMRPRTASD